MASTMPIPTSRQHRPIAMQCDYVGRVIEVNTHGLGCSRLETPDAPAFSMAPQLLGKCGNRERRPGTIHGCTGKEKIIGVRACGIPQSSADAFSRYSHRRNDRRSPVYLSHDILFISNLNYYLYYIATSAQFPAMRCPPAGACRLTQAICASIPKGPDDSGGRREFAEPHRSTARKARAHWRAFEKSPGNTPGL
jgi:hypothetical protein